MYGIRRGFGNTGQDYDDGVFVPQTTFQSKIQGGLQKFLSGTIFVGATSTDASSRKSGTRWRSALGGSTVGERLPDDAWVVLVDFRPTCNSR